MSDYPSLVKSWQISGNQLIPVQQTAAVQSLVIVLAMINAMLGLTSNPVVLSGTATTTNGSASVTFSVAQSLPSTAILYFANQPGVPYYLTGPVSGTSATLTSNFTGVGGSGQTATACSAVSNPWVVVASSNNGVANTSNNWVPVTLSGTATTTNGSTAVTFSTAQTLPASTVLYFSNQPGVPYVLSGAVSGSTSATLNTAFTGTGGSGQTTTAQSLTWASSGNRSWIVLKQVGIASNFQVLISLSNAQTYNCNAWFSPSAGFTGLTTTTADPSATDSTQIVTNQAYGNYGDTRQYRLHYWQSTDGACTRLALTNYISSGSGPVCTSYISFEVPQNPVTGWTNPAHVMWLANSSGYQELTISNLWSAYNGFGRSSANFTMTWTGEGISGNLVAGYYAGQNELNGEWPVCPIGLFSNTTGSRGRHGSLFDIWWAPANSSFNPWAAGVGWSGAAPYAFITLGNIVLPWNGTVPVLN